jgi:hypothetical protein
VLLLSWIITRLQEGLETFIQSFLPEEFFIFVLINKLISGLLNLFEVLGELLHGSINDELIFDLNKIITESGIKSWNLNGQRNEIINDTLEDIFDSIFFTVAADTWVEDYFSINQVNSDVKDWWISVMFVVWNADLVGQEAHGFGDTRSNTLDDERVNVGLVI